MAEEMGEDNIFIFGMRVDDVEKLKCVPNSTELAQGHMENDAELAAVVDS